MLRSILSFLMLSAAVLPASAQFRVVSTSIPNGATNVKLNDTLWVAFSGKINPDTMLGGPPAAPWLRYSLMPADSNMARKPILSRDSMRVGFPLTLMPGKGYAFNLQFAVSKRREPLAMPAGIRFSTGATVVMNRIAGKVTVNGVPAAEYAVLAVPDWSLSMKSLEDVRSGAMAQVTTDAEGNFSISGLPRGRYYLRAAPAARLNDRIPPDQLMDRLHETAAFYDANGDRFADVVPLEREGLQVNVTFGISTVQPSASTTAASRDSAAIAVARLGGDYKLISVAAAGPVDSTGTAAGWVYTWRNNRAGADALTYYTGSVLRLGLVYKWNGSHAAIVSGNWVNSDVIAAGMKPVIKALQAAEPPVVRAGLASVSSQQFATYEPVPAWIVTVTFKQADGRMRTNMYLWDALTGQRSQPARISAKAAVDSAEKRFNRLAAPTRPELVAVSGLSDAAGTADVWSLLYYNVAAKTMTHLSVDGKGTIRESGWRDSSAYIPPRIRGSWLDSKAILDSSAVWNAFKGQVQNPQAFLNLKTMQVPFPADTVTLWSIMMSPPPSNEPRPAVMLQDNLVAATGKPYKPASYKAFDGSDAALADARAWKADAALIRIGNTGSYTVDASGLSPIWQYIFMSPARPDTTLSIMVAGASRRADFWTRPIGHSDRMQIPALPALAGLINSDAAVQIAERERGADFRTANPDKNVMASLDQVRVTKDSTLSLWSVAYPFLGADVMGHHRVMINAATGEVLRERTRTSDRTPFETALKAAQEWSRDAQFRYAKADSVKEDGLVEVWIFGFWSPSKLQALFIEVTGGTTITRQWVTTDLPRRFARGAAIRNWLESARAIARADSALGATLRRLGLLQNVTLELTNSTAGNGKLLPGSYTTAAADYWTVSYVKNDGSVAAANIGESGTVTVDNERAESGLPRTLALEQNYPNPFNPATSIRFSVPAAGRVTLQVYNLLGQPVATLMDGVQPAGSYQVTFDARNLASGVYFYRLQAAGQTLVRRMTLVK